MKRLLPLLLALVSVPLLHAQDKKEALREISSAYDATEANYKTWRHYAISLENMEGGHSTYWHLWTDEGEGDARLRKVEADQFDDHGESKLQFFIKGDRLLFSLDRKENALIEPNATDVLERRSYFADGRLIRVLEKKGRFPTGKKTDTTSIKNRELPLSGGAAGDESPEEAYRNQHEIAAPLMDKLARVDPDAAPEGDHPAAGGAPEKTEWRVIAGTQSHDGSLALAWGLKGKLVPEGDPAEDGTYSVDAETEGLLNYVVNPRDKTILGILAGKHFGDKSHYNHEETRAVWSYSDSFLAQINNGKWATWDATLYDLSGPTDGSALKGADIKQAVLDAATKKLSGSKSLKGHQVADFALTLSEVVIMGSGDEARLWVDASGMMPKEDEAGGYDCSITFKVVPGENGSAPQLTSPKVVVKLDGN